MMTSAQVLETSVTTTDNNNSPSQDYTHPEDQTTLLQIKTLQNKNSHDKESGSHPKHVRVTRISQFLSQPFHSQDLISNSPYYLPYNFYDVSLENLDQLKVP